jgi:hypothetical protein
MFAMPSVYLRLKHVAPLHERGIWRRQTAHEGSESMPKIRCRDPGSRDRLPNDEIVEASVDVDAIHTNGFWHERVPKR